jgi:allophanate hydrolase
MAELDQDGVWTYRVEPGATGPSDDVRPLAGMRFAVKDNIDVAGIPTTLGAPSLGYLPECNATSVQRLLDAGAVFAGKTTLDQFATGLVGTRSPYFGIARNPIDPQYIAGGSSSGSAVAVARGEVPIALGTDTAGSGRVPAACCGIVGWKPTVGAVSTDGVFPASPSYDCVSVFARTVAHAARAHRALVDSVPVRPAVARVGVPGPLRWFDDDDARVRFAHAVDRVRDLGIEVIAVDAHVLYETGVLLYGSALVAERLAAFGHLMARDPAAVDPTVRSIVESASGYSARDAFTAHAQLAELRATADGLWAEVDALVLPTIARHPTIAEVLADPFGPNRELSTYTAFTNLLGWCALAVPAGTRVTGLPFGVSFMGPGHSDGALLELGARYLDEDPMTPLDDGYDLVVVGAHLTGQPLHHQLTERAARLVASTTTAPTYRLFALSTTPPKPGLVHDPDGGGPVEVEVWRLAPEAFASFVDEVPRPLAIGTVELADGSAVNGFVCEPGALSDAIEITQFGGWRPWLASRAAAE